MPSQMRKWAATLLVSSFVGGLFAAAVPAAPSRRAAAIAYPVGEDAASSYAKHAAATGACDAIGAVAQRVSVKEFVRRGDRQAIVISAVAIGTYTGSYVQQSLAVYDELGQTVVPPARGAKFDIGASREREQLFEIPEGLGDGYYYAEVLAAHAPEENGPPETTLQRLYFGIIEGEVELMSTSDWVSESGAGQGGELPSTETTQRSEGEGAP